MSSDGNHIPDRREWIDVEAAARMLRRSVGTLHNWRYHDRGPRYSKVGGRVLYRAGDVEDFLEAHVVETADGPAAN